MFSERNREVVNRCKLDLPATSDELTHWALKHAGYKASWHRRLIQEYSISLDDSIRIDEIVCEWTVHMIKNFPEAVRLKLDSWDDDINISVANVRVARTSATTLLSYVLPTMCGDKVQIVTGI